MRSGSKIFILILAVSFLFNFPFGVRIAKAQELTSLEDDKLYLDFKGASLINVLIVLSELSGINFVAGKEVANREVNMVLDGVTIDDALDAIGRGSNVAYDYLTHRNLYLFRAAADKEDQPPLVTRVFKLYYILASELREIDTGESTTSSSSTTATFASLEEKKETQTDVTSPILKIVESMLSERGRVKVDDRSNSLVVTDTEDRVKLVEEAVVQLDRRLDQVLIDVNLIETFEDLDRFIGIEWGGNTTAGQEGTLGLVQGGSKETRFPFNVNEYNALTRIFGKTSLDKQPIVEDTDVTTEGIKDFTDLDIRFRALQTAGKLKIIAKPKILVLDNHPALIKITTNEAIGQQTSTAISGSIGTQSTNVAERSETGTSLRVTPLINTDNRITMTVEPRFVTAVASANSANNTRDPTIRTARTTLMINSGQTIVIGGLLSSQQTNNVRKVPLLGDIPYVGEIFTRRTTQIDDRELILFITPSIVRDPSEVQALSLPDYRERFDDVSAPFWKWRRKKWYRNLKKEGTPEVSETAVDIQARQKLMDETMVDLSRGEESAKKKSLVESKSAQTKPKEKIASTTFQKQTTAKPIPSKPSTAVGGRTTLVGAVS
ncbi:MAG: hypothetical protein HYS55_01620 [Candidatus Omnitrophica bacterium]|nr:hypothetical protein [Candidatus Omnitrophota bacterium]